MVAANRDLRWPHAADGKSFLESDTNIEYAYDADPPPPLHRSREYFKIFHYGENNTLPVSVIVRDRFKSKEHRMSERIHIADTLEVGSSSADVKHGDRPALLHRCPLPLVLRRANTPGHYVVIESTLVYETLQYADSWSKETKARRIVLEWT